MPLLEFVKHLQPLCPRLLIGVQHVPIDRVVVGGAPRQGDAEGLVIQFLLFCLLRYHLKGPPSGSLPVSPNHSIPTPDPNSGCSISPCTSQHIPQTCDPAVVRDRQGLSCRSASDSSGLTASFECQLPRRHSLLVVFAQEYKECSNSIQLSRTTASHTRAGVRGSLTPRRIALSRPIGFRLVSK